MIDDLFDSVIALTDHFTHEQARASVIRMFRYSNDPMTEAHLDRGNEESTRLLLGSSIAGDNIRNRQRKEIR